MAYTSWYRAGMVIVACSVCACASPPPPAVSCADAMSRVGVSLAADSQVSSMAQAIAAAVTNGPRPALAEPSPISYLALSTGGQWASFGAGFLSGWSKQTGPDSRPDFQVVTGVSAGAIIAPFAFLGRGYDATLADQLGRIAAEHVYDTRGLSLLYSNSLFDTAPLAASLRENLTEEVVRQLADAATSRVLFVGAVDLVSGEFRHFDLTRIASAPSVPMEDRRSCIIEAMLASAAIPIAFPPRFIDDQIYVDGGARQHIFFEGVQEASQLLALRGGGAAPSEAVAVNAYVVINGDLTVFAEQIENSLPGVAGRTATIVVDESLRQSIFRSVTLAADNDEWTIHAITGQALNGAGGPQGAPEAFEIFDPVFTAWLFRKGVELGSTAPIPWLNAEELLDLLY